MIHSVMNYRIKLQESGQRSLEEDTENTIREKIKLDETRGS